MKFLNLLEQTSRGGVNQPYSPSNPPPSPALYQHVVYILHNKGGIEMYCLKTDATPIDSMTALRTLLGAGKGIFANGQLEEGKIIMEVYAIAGTKLYVNLTNGASTTVELTGSDDSISDSVTQIL